MAHKHEITSSGAPPPSQDVAVGLGRRHVILGGAATGLGALAGTGAYAAGNRRPRSGSTRAGYANGEETVPFYGNRQAGISTAPQAHASFIALDLRPGTTVGRIRALLKLLSDDAAALSQGKPALADTEAELSLRPARLTVTFGYGPAILQVVAPATAPKWLRALPPFPIDKLTEEFSGGDLLLQICSDDPLTVAHAQRMLLKDSRSFATLRWAQSGFRRAHGTEQAGTTMRNLFGQVDGTSNPVPDSDLFNAVVFGEEAIPAWIDNGTSLVIRRISMDLDKWDELDRVGREQSVGRTLSNGAPLTGINEYDEPDFHAVNTTGFPVIADFSHLRRARMDDPSKRIFRRVFNYDDRPVGGRISDSGMIFASYQSDVDQQYLPIQRRLAELDLLNEWTTPIGSAVFAIPPGCSPGGFVGDRLFA